MAIEAGMCEYCQNVEEKNVEIKDDSLGLGPVVVFGKSKVQQIKEGAYSVNAIDVKSKVNSMTDLTNLISRTSGVNIRTEGGLGSDYSLSINGMTGNSIRYFVDGVPLSMLGNGMTLSSFPINSVDRVEIYKGVVPAYLGGDALGGAINIVTKKGHRSFIDASVSAGSFNTYRADFNSQFSLNKHGLLFRPQFKVDYSKNNYKVHDVEVWDDLKARYDTVSRKRFHDDYFSAMGQVDLGVEHKSWADQFFVGASYSSMRKELQTGTVQSIVYGMAERKEDAFNIHVRYKKRNFLTDDLTALFLLSHTWDHSVTVDTAFLRYDWNGNYMKTSRNEINGKLRQYRHYKRPLTIARANFNYDLNEQHTLTLNYMLSRMGNKIYDTAKDYYFDSYEYDVTLLPSNDLLEKHIIGISYDQNLIDGKLVNTFFLKDYVTRVDVEQTYMSSTTHSDDVPNHSVTNNWGYGLGSRYSLLDCLSAKFSYEHAVRIPEAKELLGNGSTIYANLALDPEQSHNFNLGMFGSFYFGGDNSINYELGAFYRITQDYIHLTVNTAEGTAQYENINDVTTRGFEGEVRYNHGRWLQFIANASYQESRDMEKFLDNGNRSATYKNRIPNKPWLYGNTELILMKDELFSKDDKLRFSYAFQYTHWFYLTWESYGYKPSKARIPSQYLQNAALTYSWNHERYNLTLSCDNIFDTLCYDNFKLQKPGRSFMAKFRLYLGL
ncbi:MAG: TonB-dependent receptor [Bacteroidaceae bacterium]|nr:TonB-dependent receptor [Bacteroidaceae bacterium]